MRDPKNKLENLEQKTIKSREQIMKSCEQIKRGDKVKYKGKIWTIIEINQGYQEQPSYHLIRSIEPLIMTFILWTYIVDDKTAVLL